MAASGDRHRIIVLASMSERAAAEVLARLGAAQDLTSAPGDSPSGKSPQ